MAANVIISALDDTQSLATSDGNDLLETVAGVNQKREFSDVFGESLDPHWTIGKPLAFSGWTENGSVVESGGKVRITTIRAGSPSVKGIHTDYLFNDGTFIIDIDNFQYVTGTLYTIFYLIKDVNNYAYIRRRYASGGSNNDFVAYIVAGGVLINSANSADIGNQDFSLSIERDGNDFDLLYDIGAGFVPLLSDTGAIGSDCRIEIANLHYDYDGTNYWDLMEFAASGTGVYWDSGNEIATYISKTTDENGNSIVGKKLDFSAADLTTYKDASTKLDVSLNGGSSYILSDADDATVLALGEQTVQAGGLKIKSRHGNGTGQSTYEKILVPRVGGLVPAPLLMGQMLTGVA